MPGSHNGTPTTSGWAYENAPVDAMHASIAGPTKAEPMACNTNARRARASTPATTTPNSATYATSAATGHACTKPDEPYATMSAERPKNTAVVDVRGNGVVAFVAFVAFARRVATKRWPKPSAMPAPA